MKKKIVAILFVAIIISCMAFAISADTIGDKIEAAIDNTKTELLKIVNPVAGLAIIFLGIAWIVSSDPTTIRKVRTSFLSIAGALLLINYGSDLVNWVNSL